MAQVKFYTCTQAQYAAAKTAKTLLEGALYFTTDTKRLYRGETLYGGSLEYVSTLTGVEGAIGTLYYAEDTGAISIFNGTDFVTKYLPQSQTLTSDSTHGTVPTSKAVYDAIDAEATTRSAVDTFLSGKIDVINGGENAEGSFAKAVKDAKDAISGSIGSGFDSSNTVKTYIETLSGKVDDVDEFLSGKIELIDDEANVPGSFRYGDAALSASIGGNFTSEYTVSAAIAAIDSAAISISGAAENAIEVTSAGEGGVNKTVGLKINANDKYLTQDSDGLSATITLVRAETLTGEVNAAEYYLAGKDGTQLGPRINIPKDQFLKSATFKEGSGSGDDYIELVFNTSTGTENTVPIPLSGLFDEYTKGPGIDLKKTATGIEISGVVDDSGEFLTIGPNGFKVDGVTDAINAGDTALSGAIGAGFDQSGTTVKAYIDAASGFISGAIGVDPASGNFTSSNTVVSYINSKVEGLASSTATSLSGKLDDVAENKAGEIIIAKADGKVEVSGKEVGGATIAAAPTADVVATEIAVSAFVDEKIEDALTGALTWNTL